ncbi:MAG: threonine dehydratase [Oceanicoccus sp.]|jgi:threonine dehydratase
MLPPSPSISDIEKAAARIINLVHRTPIMSSRLINDIAGCKLSFKCENLQKTGAFKARGASNAVMQLSEKQAAKGVATHSSGNHGAALALAAQNRNIPAFVVLPNNAPQLKIKAVEGYGANLIFCEPTLAAREHAVDAVVANTGAHYVPPYDYFDVICGQGTVGLEILEQLAGEEPDVIITPVGGGGLLSGTAIAVKSKAPNCKVIGAEPEGADDAFRSFKLGQHITQHTPDTIADGLRTTLGKINFHIIRNHVDDILLVNDQQIITAMQLIWSRMKLIVEPSAAVPLAAVLANKELFSGQHIAIVLSGGNIDLQQLPWQT